MSAGIDFSSISDRRILGKCLRLPLGLIPTNTIVPVLQGALRGKRWIVGSSNHGCWLGSYEYSKQHLFAEKVGQGDVVLDIGAHVGFYTLLSSVLVGASGRVFAFEPVPRNLLFLKKHLELNGIANVTVIEAAVSNRSGVTYFEEKSQSSMGCISETGNLTVNTVTLDEMAMNKQIPAPDYIKIDVEGAEMSVLRGAQALLKNAHPTIFLATHGQEFHEASCSLLSSLGYHLRAIDGQDASCSDEILAEPAWS